MRNFIFYRAYYALFVAVTLGLSFGHITINALNEYLKSKRGVRGDFSPSRERALRKQKSKPPYRNKIY